MIAENTNSTYCQPEEKSEEEKQEPVQENENVPRNETFEPFMSVDEPPSEASFEEYEQFVSSLWSKITRRDEPVKEKGWFEKYILQDVKKCYTPSATASYYQYHRRVEADSDDFSFDPRNDNFGPGECSQENKCKDECSKLFYSRFFSSPYPNAFICCLAKLLTAAFQLIAIGAAFYYLHKWWVLRAEYKAIIRVRTPNCYPIVPNYSKPQGGVATVPDSGRSVGCIFRKLIHVGLFGLVIVFPMALAIYYRLACSFYKYVYTKTYEEVREAQNDRILLENELVKVQNDPRSENVYDEIGDTKRQIMLGEIERISQYLQEAKNEILLLMDEKDQLKRELRQAVNEKNDAKQTFDSAVKCIVQEDAKEAENQIDCACATFPMQNQCSSPR